MGHGSSKTTQAALAHARSAAAVGSTGVTFEVLADCIAAWEQWSHGNAPWLVVVIDACRSARFAELLAATIDDRQGPRRVLVLGTSGRGSTTPS